MINITDWLMVIITTVYVIATIWMSISNYKLCILTHNQFETLKLQYKNNIVLGNMPFLEINIIAPCNHIDYEAHCKISELYKSLNNNKADTVVEKYFCFSNVGDDAVRNLTIDFVEWEKISFVTSIPPRREKIFKLTFDKIDAYFDGDTIGIIEYDNRYGIKYFQAIILCYDEDRKEHITVSPPAPRKEIDEIFP